MNCNLRDILRQIFTSLVPKTMKKSSRDEHYGLNKSLDKQYDARRIEMDLREPLSSITEADLQVLKANEVAEGKSIEYKEALPKKDYKSKREFLADASSFANAAGGHLIYGIKEEEGVPTEINGLSGIDADAEKLRLENMLRDSIDPRIPGVEIKEIRLLTSAVVIVVRIPNSWARPHVVNYRKHWRFYSRNSAGKYPLDVSELRDAFALSDTLTKRVRQFRTERLGNIVAGETPVPVGDGAKIVLHIVPFGAFDPSKVFHTPSLGDDVWKLSPIYGRAHHHRYNLDGLVTYSQSRSDENPAHPYVQLFRNGIIESVDTRMLVAEGENVPHIPSQAYEDYLLKTLPKYLSVQEELDTAPPLFVMLSMLGVSGYIMGVRKHLDLWGENRYPIDRDALLLPEIVIEGFDVDLSEVMRPVFDSVWNAAGWPKSMNYDESGKWGKGPNYR